METTGCISQSQLLLQYFLAVELTLDRGDALDCRLDVSEKTLLAEIPNA